MCIIAYARDRKLTEEEVISCWDNNDDGAGLAWYEKGKTRFIKGIETLEEFNYLHEQLDQPYIAHFRIVSSGTKKPELTHPFVVSRKSPLILDGTGKTLLFHNGTITSWKDLYFTMRINGIKLDGDVMDTRVMAVLASIDQSFLEEYAGTSKFILMKNDGITHINMNIEDNGVLFSNTTYKFGRIKNYNSNNLTITPKYY